MALWYFLLFRNNPWLAYKKAMRVQQLSAGNLFLTKLIKNKLNKANCFFYYEEFLPDSIITITS